jgi:hypothetical protein
MEVDPDEVRFERRREREHKRSEKGGKRKGVKVIDKDWILKKKEVRYALHMQLKFALTLTLPRCSFTDSEARRTCREIQSLRGGSGGRCSDVVHNYLRIWRSLARHVQCLCVRKWPFLGSMSGTTV